VKIRAKDRGRNPRIVYIIELLRKSFDTELEL
jgi:hypothetical protein